jgi:four helix bundle protein
MPSAQSFESLIVWQKAHQFVLATYHLTNNFPRPELYGLSAQLRRAAISLPANIAEGFQKRGNADKARFFNIAQGSQAECDYYLILAKDLGYADTDQLRLQLSEVGRLLNAYLYAILASNKA